MIFDLLSEAHHLDRIIPSYPGLKCGMTDPWMDEIRASILHDSSIQQDVRDCGSEAAVRSMLDANTRTPVKLPSDVRFEDFISHYTGPKLRWESVGIFFTACGLSLVALDCSADELKFIGNSEKNKQHLMFRLLEAGDQCVSLCNKFNVSGTDLAFWLMLENCVHASQVLGDAHHSVWRRQGEMATTVFASGLHEEQPDQPIWLREVRRRVLGLTYASDNTLSTFVGRPPRISKRYCKIQPHLDLEDAELALPATELAEVCARLDPSGWSIRPSIEWRSALKRIYVMTSLICEDVLELCLGPTQDDLETRAQDLINQNQALYASFPQHLKYSPHGPRDSPPTFPIIHKYLDNTYNEFVSPPNILTFPLTHTCRCSAAPSYAITTQIPHHSFSLLTLSSLPSSRLATFAALKLPA